MSARENLDPRWEWVEVADLGAAEPTYIRGCCRHTETVPVAAVDGETVATLCLTCDEQLPVERGEWQA